VSKESLPEWLAGYSRYSFRGKKWRQLARSSEPFDAGLKISERYAHQHILTESRSLCLCLSRDVADLSASLSTCGAFDATKSVPLPSRPQYDRIEFRVRLRVVESQGEISISRVSGPQSPSQSRSG